MVFFVSFCKTKIYIIYCLSLSPLLLTPILLLPAYGRCLLCRGLLLLLLLRLLRLHVKLLMIEHLLRLIVVEVVGRVWLLVCMLLLGKMLRVSTLLGTVLAIVNVRFALTLLSCIGWRLRRAAWGWLRQIAQESRQLLSRLLLVVCSRLLIILQPS